MLDSARQSAFEILFGHEPLTSANSEQDASEALRQSAELVAREFDGVRESPPVRGELAAEISSSGDRIRAAAHVALTEPEPLLRVVMQGKTMAGKSTLLEALSCGDGGRRGEGGQRTSREVEEREVTELPGVVLVDVPGVGAADGEDDREKALAQISRADVVLWVATNEAPKNDTADALRRIAMLGKPVIVAINCRQSLDQPPHRDRFLANPESLFARAGELAASVERHLKGEGNSSIAWNALHADAAFRALSGGPDAEALRRSSGIDQLLSLLDRIRTRSLFISHPSTLSTAALRWSCGTHASRQIRCPSGSSAGRNRSHGRHLCWRGHAARSTAANGLGTVPAARTGSPADMKEPLS